MLECERELLNRERDFLKRERQLMMSERTWRANATIFTVNRDVAERLILEYDRQD